MSIQLFLTSAPCSFLVETMGTERVMLGSDYPFPLGEHRVGSLIRAQRLCRTDESPFAGRECRKFLGLQ